MLAVAESVGAAALWPNRFVGWCWAVIAGFGALIPLRELASGNLDPSTWVMTAIPLAVGWLALRYVRRMRDGKRHPAYVLLRDHPERVRKAVRSSSTPSIDFLDFHYVRPNGRTRSVRLAIRRLDAPAFQVVLSRALPALQPPARAA